MRAAELVAVERLTEKLQTTFASTMSRVTPRPSVEVVSGREATTRVYAQMQQAATAEICGFAKQPLASPMNDEEFPALRRGIRYRAVYDRDLVELPGYIDVVRTWVEAGEEARVLSDVPMKLILADDRLAMVPISLEGTEFSASLLVRPSSLLRALRLLFETLWERAVPVRLAEKTVRKAGRPTAEDDRLMFMLAAGLTDAAIARQLGVRPRTAQRKVAGLMGALGADTRFQAGLQALEKGWLPRVGLRSRELT